MKDYSIYKLNENLAYVFIKKYNILNKDLSDIEKKISEKYKSAIIDNLLTVGKNSSNRFYFIVINEGKFDFDNALYSKDISKLLNQTNVISDKNKIISKVNQTANKNKDILDKSSILRFQ
ncbi:hypothetical protein [Mariniplasma anaerobium]|uniref:Uncharacterized protein n=1 Tax=Mariniplasma anaerobium TaxID=2735436 RepID=A0A7U9TJ69_9MOLU|nr:hypothetical protein [Mariniplasma anaerobium]BCR35554.1 hypothetical protein MPAN_004470 [Mariniplasma anaerobium]